MKKHLLAGLVAGISALALASAALAGDTGSSGGSSGGSGNCGCNAGPATELFSSSGSNVAGGTYAKSVGNDSQATAQTQITASDVGNASFTDNAVNSNNVSSLTGASQTNTIGHSWATAVNSGAATGSSFAFKMTGVIPTTSP